MSDSKPHKRVTLADIGKATGYHFSTVGYALRNHPAIPEKTKAKIRKMAEKMGYRPDPALSSLIAYRKNRSKTDFQTTIGVISDSDSGESYWRSNQKGNIASCEYWKGMKARAGELGYRLIEFSVNNDRRNEKRVDEILLARGITAVILTPMENTRDPIQLTWERLSAVAIGYSLASPELLRVTHQHRKGAQTAVEELIALGYRKIAFVAPYEFDARVDHAWSSGFFGTCKRLGIENSCCHYMPRKSPTAWTIDFHRWLKTSKPDVILSALGHLQDILEAHGYRFPQDIGLADLGLPDPGNYLSGIDQNSFIIGQECINLISSQYINNIRGIPEHEYIHQVRGFWKQGQTTARQPGRAEKDKRPKKQSV